MQVIEAHLAELDVQLESEPERKIVSSVSELNDLREIAMVKKLELETVLIRDSARFRDDAPEIKALKDQIFELNALVDSSPGTREQSKTTAINQAWVELSRKRSNLRAELSGLSAGVTSMRETLEKMIEALTKAPELAARLRDIDRELSVAQQVYKVLLTKRAQADVSLLSAEQAMPTMTVVDYAVPPASKSWPKAKYLYPIALLCGLMLGIIAALIKSMLGQRVTLFFLEQQAGLYAATSVVSINTRLPYRPVEATPRVSLPGLDLDQ